MPTERSKSEIALEVSVTILKMIGIIILALVGFIILMIISIVYLLIWLSKEEVKTTEPVINIEPKHIPKPVKEAPKISLSPVTPVSTYSSASSCSHGPNIDRCSGCSGCLDCLGRADGWHCHNCGWDDDDDD